MIPVFNAERFVESTIRSAAAQTYPGLKIVAIDDGSTDSSPDILRRLAAELPNLTVRRVANGGVARARNLGTEISQSDLVAYLDADDLWHPTKIEKQVAALRRHDGDDEWAACYVGYRLIDERGLFLLDRKVRLRSGTFFCSHLMINYIGNGSGLLVRRKIALEVGGFDPSYADNGIGGCEDWDFQLRLLRRHKMEVVPEFLVGYRVYPGNMSSDKGLMARSRLAVIDRFSSVRHVDAAVRRKAMSAAHRVAYVRFWRAGHLAAAFRSLLLQLVLDPRAGFAEIRRKIGYRVERFLPADPSWIEHSVAESVKTCEFSSLDPADGAEAAFFSPGTQYERWLGEMDRKYHSAALRENRGR